MIQPIDSALSSDPAAGVLRLIADINGQPVPLSPAVLARLAGQLAQAAGQTAAEIRAAIDQAEHKAAAIGFVRAGRVALIPVHGVIRHRPSAIEAMFGIGASGMRIEARLRAALADPDIAAILLDVDSPGGTVGGVAELADLIHAARGAKPIVAVANTIAASAAYWLAAQADELVVTQSGEVGSIGVWTAHVDFSEFEKRIGVKTTLISAGEFKVEGNPYEPLSDEARAELQRGVDAVERDFVAAVARGRGVTVATVRSDFGKGRMVRAKEAVKAGMADRVGTLADTVARLQRPARRSTRPTRSIAFA